MCGQGSPAWLIAVKKAICEELDQVQGDVRCFGTFRYEVDLRASHARWAVKAHSQDTLSGYCHKSLIGFNYGEHVGGDGLVDLGTESEDRHGVTVSTHCEIRGEFV